VRGNKKALPAPGGAEGFVASSSTNLVQKDWTARKTEEQLDVKALVGLS
jgi:hypothetical protein